jgi:hypothetical protein
MRECPACGSPIAVKAATEEQRSRESHNHYMAAVNEAWLNLPDKLAARFTSAEMLRKYALCRAGYCNAKSLICPSVVEAIRVAAFIRPMDEFSIVYPEGQTVWVFTARSQSFKAMGKDEFQRSKDAVLSFIAGLLGATPEELKESIK